MKTCTFSAHLQQIKYTSHTGLLGMKSVTYITQTCLTTFIGPQLTQISFLYVRLITMVLNGEDRQYINVWIFQKWFVFNAVFDRLQSNFFEQVGESVFIV